MHGDPFSPYNAVRQSWCSRRREDSSIPTMSDKRGTSKHQLRMLLTLGNGFLAFDLTERNRETAARP